jgi:hypothetical protein
MDTKGVEINRKSKNRQYNGQKFEDNKGSLSYTSMLVSYSACSLDFSFIEKSA